MSYRYDISLDKFNKVLIDYVKYNISKRKIRIISKNTI